MGGHTKDHPAGQRNGVIIGRPGGEKKIQKATGNLDHSTSKNIGCG